MPQLHAAPGHKRAKRKRPQGKPPLRRLWLPLRSWHRGKSLLGVATYDPDARTSRMRITIAYLVMMLWVRLAHCLPQPRRQGNPERPLGEKMTFYIDPTNLVAPQEE